MQCEFCKEAMHDDAVVCPHCRKEPSVLVQARRSKTGGQVALLVAMVFGILLLALVFGHDSKDPAERIKEACANEFPSDERSRLSCQIELTAEAIQKQTGNSDQRARDEAGVR